MMEFFTPDNMMKFAAFASACVGYVIFVKVELASLRSDVSQIKEQQKMLIEGLKQLNNVLTQIAVQDVRISMIERDIDDLRHKRGFIE